MSSYWFYGLVKQKDGKIRVWEINESKIGKKLIVWGHPAVKKWMLKDIHLLVKDILLQLITFSSFNKFGLYEEEWFDKGTKKITKHLSKIYKNLK